MRENSGHIVYSNNLSGIKTNSIRGKIESESNIAFIILSCIRPSHKNSNKLPKTVIRAWNTYCPPANGSKRASCLRGKKERERKRERERER